MVTKKYCDVCNAEMLTDAAEEALDHNKAANYFTGHFRYAAIVIDEMDDLCAKCGAKVRDYIRQLKKEMSEK